MLGEEAVVTEQLLYPLLPFALCLYKYILGFGFVLVRQNLLTLTYSSSSPNTDLYMRPLK